MVNRSSISKGRPRVTLKQIAEATGVSRTTVCDILHRNIEGRYSYKEETRDRVFKAVQALGYTPSLAARQLRKGRSGRVGLMLTTDFSGQFFALVASVAERELRAREYRLQIAVTDGNAQTEHEQMVRLQEDAVEGLIVGPVYDPVELEQHRNFFQGRLPTVLFGGVCGSEFDEVALDHTAARRLAAEHLLALGHRRIGFLCAPRSPSTHEPVVVIHNELKKLGIDYPKWILRYDIAESARNLDQSQSLPIKVKAITEPSVTDFANGAAEFASRWKSASPSDRPTAMICLNDDVAMTAIAALAKLRIRVPQDISLVGCDNLRNSEYLLPPLTTVDNHADQQMQAAVDQLQKRMKEPAAPPTVRLIKPTLVVRESVREITATAT